MPKCLAITRRRSTRSRRRERSRRRRRKARRLSVPLPAARGEVKEESWEEFIMRIVVHGQQAFGKAVLEALLKRGENVVAVYVAPEKEGAKADPLKEAALAAKLPVFQPDVLQEAGSSGGIQGAQARSAGHGLRHAVRAGRVPQHPDQGLDPVPPLAAAGLSRRVRHQLADHHGRKGSRPVDLLAGQRARYRRRAHAEEDADRRHRHARHGLFRSPVPDGRRGDAGIGRSGEGRQGAAHQAGRHRKPLTKAAAGRAMPRSTGASPGARSTR